MKNRIFALTLLSLFLYTNSKAQDLADKEKDNKWEGNVSEIYFYGPTDRESSWGTEVHISYEFVEKWFAGASVTFKYGLQDKKVNELAILAGYEPAAWLCLNFGVDFAFIDENNEKSTETTFYNEAEFNLLPYKNQFNFGPLIGSLLGKNSEIYAGLHFELKF